MQRPFVLSRRNPNFNKKDFGHLLIVAGSPQMLGASALASLAAMRSGAGLVTAAIPKSLNSSLQEKLSHVVMTLPMAETRNHCFSSKAYDELKSNFKKYDVLVIGPGLGRNKSTIQFIHKLIENYPGPMLVDADALFALALKPNILLKSKGPRILTPHEGEMARFFNNKVRISELNRKNLALNFVKKYSCILVLKGRNTLVVSENGQVYINMTGNVGMATAGSGDVLSGMIGALMAQGIKPFEASCWAVYCHGKAGDIASKKFQKVSIIAVDLIESIAKLI